MVPYYILQGKLSRENYEGKSFIMLPMIVFDLIYRQPDNELYLSNRLSKDNPFHSIR